VALWRAVTIDTTDPPRLAAFWSALLDAPVVEPGPDRIGWLRLEPVDGGPVVNFQPVAAHASSSRIHLDVLVDDIDAGVAQVCALGGADTGARETLPRGRIAVMTDPDGNVFCLLAPPA
jgi:predicted enzyme related to lactoylglutathione lyase